MSIEAAEGVTTGISAADRARTVQAAVAPDAQPADIVQPGHIFPLMAQPGGVLVRAGHTEAGCDLARLAGLTPAAVICEIMNDDGAMARLPDLMTFARAARAEDRHDRRPDPLPQPHREAGRAHRRAPAHDARTARSGWSSIATRCPTRRTSRWCAGRCRPDTETLVRVHEPLSVMDLLDARKRVALVEHRRRAARRSPRRAAA